MAASGPAAAGTTPTGSVPIGTLEFKQYPNGIGVNAATQHFFFPYKIIQHLSLTKGGTPENPIWTLHIRTTTDKINLQSSRNLEVDFASICMLYH